MQSKYVQEVAYLWEVLPRTLRLIKHLTFLEHRVGYFKIQKTLIFRDDENINLFAFFQVNICSFTISTNTTWSLSARLNVLMIRQALYVPTTQISGTNKIFNNYYFLNSS